MFPDNLLIYSQVLSLIRGTGCDEQVGEGGDDDITSECKPAKLRVISRSPESELGTTTSQVSYGSNTLSAVRGSHNDSAAGEAQLTESPKKEQGEYIASLFDDQSLVRKPM